MSITANRELSSWKTVLARLRRTETTWRGSTLSDRDHASYTEAILCNALVLSDLSNRYRGMGTHRDHVAWAINTASLDVDEVGRFLSDVVDRLLNLSFTEGEGTRLRTYSWFKRQLSSDYPFVGRYLAPIKDALDLYGAEPSPDSLYPVYQFLAFLTHLSLLDLSNGAELEEGYVQQEELLASQTLPFRYGVTNEPYYARLAFWVVAEGRNYLLTSDKIQLEYATRLVLAYQGIDFAPPCTRFCGGTPRGRILVFEVSADQA